MDGVGELRRLTATGLVPPHTTGGICWGGTLTPAAAVATVEIRENGASGTVIAKVQAAANGSSVPIPAPFRYEGQLHATLSGTGAEAAFLI